MTCRGTGSFNGPEKEYVARLYNGVTLQDTKQDEKCDFVFEDLSYSTTYTVKVGMILMIALVYSPKFFHEEQIFCLSRYSHSTETSGARPWFLLLPLHVCAPNTPASKDHMVTINFAASLMYF